ncbi:UNVERIFIED_CONTAM: hypothetical protein N8J90_00285 [Halobacillus marinus]
MRGADLVKKAEAQAAFYAENSKIEVIFLAGSVARGWDDAKTKNGRKPTPTSRG